MKASLPSSNTAARPAATSRFRAVATGVNAPPVPIQVVIAVENYGIMFRNLENGIPVTLELNVDNRFYDQDLNAFNIVGRFPEPTRLRNW